MAVYRDFIREQNPGLDPQQIEARAQQLLEDLQRTHPLAPAEFERTTPSSRCPDRAGINSKVEIAAMRSLPEAIRLEELLKSCNGGRAAARELPLAVFECMAWTKARPEIRSCYEDLLDNNPIRDWAYGYPRGRANENDRCESTVYSTLRAMIERHDPVICIELNLALIRQLAERDPDIGRYVAIDGTDYPAPVEQRSSISPSEESLLRREMSARMLSHGRDKNWRGWLELTLVDLKSTLPLAWIALPLDRGSEFLGVPLLLDLLFEFWPECPIEFLVGDKAFDVHDLNFELEYRYAIHPVWNVRQPGASSKYPWASDDGVPRCSRHGLMKLHQSEDFFAAQERRQHGLRLGELASAQLRARIRFVCPEPACLSSATTYPKNNARIYTYLPHHGQHRRTGLRIALLRRRNQAESVIRSVKACGVALGGVSQPLWVSTDRRAEWLAGASFLGLTLRRMAHETGAYTAMEAESRGLGLI